MSYEVGSKVSILHDCPATVIFHGLREGIFGLQEMTIECRLDLAMDARSYGQTTFAFYRTEDVRPDGVVSVRSEQMARLIVTVPVAEWAAACAKARRRRGKDEVDAETAARGQILGRAAQIKAWRAEAAAPIVVTDHEAETAAADVAAILSRPERGLSRRERQKTAAAAASMPDLVEMVRPKIMEHKQQRRQACLHASETSWEIW